MTFPRVALLALLVGALGFSSSKAEAQPGGYYAPPPPPPPGYQPPAPVYQPGIQRQGFLIGFSVGFGGFGLEDCAECDTFQGVAADIHAGWMITPTFALMFDGSGVSHAFEDGSGSLTHVLNTVAGQMWVTPKLWLKGGLGVGRLSVSDADGFVLEESEVGSGVLIGAGYEIVQTRTFALDLSLRGSAVTYDNADTVTMSSLNVGFNWY